MISKFLRISNFKEQAYNPNKINFGNKMICFLQHKLKPTLLHIANACFH